MSSADDNWPRYSIGLKDHFHAIGIIIHCWSQIEYVFYQLASYACSNDSPEFEFICKNMRDDTRFEIVRNAIIPKLPVEEAEYVKHFLSCAAICKTYRDSFAHSRFDNIVQNSELVTIKGFTKDLLDYRTRSWNVSDLRYMADASYETWQYGSNVWGALTFRKLNSDFDRSAGSPEPSFAWPDKPALPQNLTQILDIPKQSPPRHQSSGR
ncbi:hypothetical protein [Methylobacterium pseudosasicola]|uniref:hypothetical protein n=1 Tax=Methylobacterium pseudosasicola TaxID=582667 RepID=UPI001113E13F|nr:hypothetical protein [Methylobacterium pseudosasicola]